MKHSLYAWIAVCGALAVFSMPVAAQESKPKPGERDARRGKVPAKRAEQFFKRLDANGDGKITKDEVPERFKPRMDALLQQAGKGQDGSISKEEFGKLIAQRGGPHGRPGERRGGPQGGHGGFHLPLFFQKLDADKDGALSKDEVTKAVEKFDELDKNKDGKLDPRELFGPRPGGPQFGRGRPGQRPEGAGRGEFAERFFKQADKNNDGKISQDEAPERLKQHFSKFDANSDGAVDLDEFKKGFAGRRGGRPGGQRPEGRRKRDNRKRDK